MDELRETKLLTAISILKTTVRCLLASAVPNERDHPTMFREWELAEQDLVEVDKWTKR